MHAQSISPALSYQHVRSLLTSLFKSAWVKKYGHLYPVVQVSLGFHFTILFQEGETVYQLHVTHHLYIF